MNVIEVGVLASCRHTTVILALGTQTHILTLFLYFSPPHKPTLCSSDCDTHTFPLYGCVKRQGRDFSASEVMRPPLLHSLQCSADSPGHSFTLSKPRLTLWFTLYAKRPHHFYPLSIFPYTTILFLRRIFVVLI